MLSEESQLAFARALSDSVRSGLPLGATLRGLARASYRSRALESAAELVERGTTLHEALEPQGLFPPLFVALVRAGEESGKTDAFLDRYADWLEVRLDFRRRLRRAFFYPAAACLLAASLFVLFSAKAAPLLLRPLLDAGAPLPDGALRAMRVGDLLLARWPELLGAFFAVVLALRSFAGSGMGRRLAALAGHWLPGFRYALEEARYHRIASALQLLLAAGLRPRQLMDILLQYFSEDPVTSRRLARAAALLSEGKGYSESLGVCLSEEDRPRLAVAEKAGRLDETLGRVAASHHDRHSHRLKQLASAFQLAAVAALAPVCFGLVMWIVMPSLSLLGGGVPAPLYHAGPDEAGRPSPLPVPAPVPAAERARFNETRARAVVGVMDAAAPGKPAPRPKLKSAAPFKKIESTPIRSGLDR